MADVDIEALLEELETDLREDVQAALTLTAQDFAESVGRATELVAASFSVSRVGRMWQRRVNGIMDRLRSIAGRAARDTAQSNDAPQPSSLELDRALTPWMDATRGLLNAVGDRLAAEATQSLAEGVNAGETLDELKARMITLFNDSGAQLGPARAQRIAATEATRAWNAGAIAAAEAIEGPERPLIKQWITRQDERVRPSHREANGQIQLLSEPFDVGGTKMQYPGDPTAPAAETLNCRCVTRVAAPAMPATDVAASGVVALQSTMPPQLKEYWLAGPGAAKIGWGTPGSFDRCVRALGDKFPSDTEGLCANLYHEATGRWPGRQQGGAEVHTGAMIALIPSYADAERLALTDGEAADQLHLTLAYLGDAVDWDPASQVEIHAGVSLIAAALRPVAARAFGVALWNPGEGQCNVWNVGDDHEAEGATLDLVHSETWRAIGGYDCPAQHTPWQPHIAAAYGDADHGAMADRAGALTFDRIRVAFAGEYTDYPLEGKDPQAVDEPVEAAVDGPQSAPAGDMMPPNPAWSTPGDTALAFENQQTGDGRIFAPGALYWSGEGPWPLQYADEMLDGHGGAELAGSIEALGRDGDRITGQGVLYMSQDAGRESAALLAQGAPLGVSVDLDDVTLEVVSQGPGDVPAEPYSAQLATASVVPLPDGGWSLTGETAPRMVASGGSTLITSRKVSLLVGANGMVSGRMADLVAAAGDPDLSNGQVLERQSSGDHLMRVTRARLRGATLVTLPAFADARIVLEGGVQVPVEQDGYDLAASSQSSDYERALRHVRRSSVPVGAGRLAQFLNMPVVAAQRTLALAASRGEVVRLTRGLYTDKTTSAKADHVMMDNLLASVTGRVDLPVASRDTMWNGDEAKNRVFTWAGGDVDKLRQAFAYQVNDADPQLKGSWKLGVADVIDGSLRLVPKGVAAALAAVNGARGGVDIPADELDAVRTRLEEMRAHVNEETGQASMDGMQASAWAAMSDLPPMPAAWFREPTTEELPPGSAGVHYSNGRIFGWVAQADEPHAGYAKRVVINELGKIDTTHFLRQRFTLDDGSLVKAGAFTMNAGHHRDGAECETSACQFDDTRTVAGIVTVGMNARGMWFSGAAAPWMSEWDRTVFMAAQPSYHLKKGGNGQWQLRAVLSVPVPGHSSPLLASAVMERSNLALTAAATMVEVEEAVAAAAKAEDAMQASMPGIDYDKLADAMVASLARAEQRRKDEAEELAELLAEASRIE